MVDARDSNKVQILAPPTLTYETLLKKKKRKKKKLT